MRHVLGAALGVSPRKVRLERGTHGKPRLATAHGVDIRFNLSHAAERAVLAVTLGREVGVDVEACREIEALELARRFFAPGESAAMEALPAAERTEAFFRLWTCKESYLKARGEGLLARLDAFEFDPASHPARLLWSALDPEDTTRWHVMGFSVVAGYVGALAVEGHAPAVRVWSCVGFPSGHAGEPARPQKP
jgi:4'-phosphopantetheinyl transferase